MFGNKKYQKGMEAASKVYEAKFEQHTDALKRLQSNFGDAWKQSEEVADAILNKVEENERARIYGLHAQIDIKTLKQDHKDIIVAILYTLSPETSNEFQQSYIRSVQKYLGIKIPQSNIDFSSLENIDDLTTQKAIFQVCVEYLFLANNNPDFFEQYKESLFKYFSLNEKAMLGIWENVLQIYTATGPLGLAEKYGFVPKPPERTVDVGAPAPVELEDETIENDIHIPTGEGRKFQAKNIRLNANIHCDGELAFDNCVIVYNGDDIKGRIHMKKNTSLIMSHCTFIGKNNEKRNEGYGGYHLIEGYDRSSQLFIKDCLFFNCLSFAKNAEIVITNCIVRYTKLPPLKTALFYCDKNSNSKAIGCLFESLDGDILDRIALNRALLRTKNDKTEVIKKHFKVNSEEELNNILLKRFNVNSDDIKSWLDWYSLYNFSTTRLFDNFKELSGCNVKNLSSFLSCHDGPLSVTHCQFVNCFSILSYHHFGSREQCIIANCSFDNCGDIIPTANFLELKNSQFLNCYGQIRFWETSNILLCQFYRINNGRIEGVTSRGMSTISQCLFDGIFVPEGTNFISSIIKNKDITVSVDDCEFKHCITQHPDCKIIKREHYSKTFFGKEIPAIRVNNCRGLENVNKEGELTEEIILKQETTTGQPIGARIDEAMVGVPGYTVDFTLVD